jgi:hypothetical protein
MVRKVVGRRSSVVGLRCLHGGAGDRRPMTDDRRPVTDDR